MIKKLLPYTWIGFSYHVQVHHYVDPFVLDGEVEDVESLLKSEARQLLNRYVQSVKVLNIVVRDRENESLEATVKVPSIFRSSILDELLVWVVVHSHFKRCLEHLLLFIMVG